MYGILHLDGSGEDNPPVEKLSTLYDELLVADPEHGEVAVVDDDSRWCLSVYRNGLIVFEQLGTRGTTARHMGSVSKARVLELWRRLIKGEIDGLLAEPWIPGYGAS
jgi:hypothetical protein